MYLERVILACSNEDRIVLDPFVGNRITPTVPLEWGHHFISTEYRRQMAASVAKRIERGMVRRGMSQGQSRAIFATRRPSER